MDSPHKGPVIWTICLLTCLPEGAAEQSIELPVTRDAIAPMWRHFNGFGKSNDSIQKAICRKSRWRHQMVTFSALLVFCAGNSSITGEFPRQRPVTRSFAVFFDPRLDQQLSKQWRRWWFETPSRSLWRQCNGFQGILSLYALQPQVCQVCASYGNKPWSFLWITLCFSSYLARLCILHNEHKPCRPWVSWWIVTSWYLLENILSIQLNQNNMFYQYFDDWQIKSIKAK